MDNTDEVWLVAGGEPGAARFGQLVQRLRKDQSLSVEALAARAELSVGTIRAIEQGRRAPSEASGVRLLQSLLPEGAQPSEPGGSAVTGRGSLDYSFDDPFTGRRVVLEFKAKTAGDNRRWSIDKPRAAESKAEALMRELWSDPERSRAFVQAVGPTLVAISSYAADLKSQLAHPAGDAVFGRVARRLTTANWLRLGRIEALLDVWDGVDDGTASVGVRDLASELNALLDSYMPFPPDADITVLD